jgi:hypothetical protein
MMDPEISVEEMLHKLGEMSGVIKAEILAG